MKKYLILFVLFLLAFTKSYSQDSTQVKTIGLIFKVDLLFPTMSLLTKGHYFDFSIEKTITKRQSVQLTGIIHWSNNGIGKNSLTEIVPEYRFYISPTTKNNGMFIGGYFKYSKQNYEFNYETDSVINKFNYKILFLGGFIGYQTSFFKRLNVDFLLGLGRGKIIHEELIQGRYIGDKKSLQFDFRGAINIGYIF